MKNMTKEQLQQELMSVADRVLLKSEIEAPFEFSYYSLRPGEQFTPETVVEWAGKPAGMTVETKELDAFIDEMKGIVPDVRTADNQPKLYQQLTDKLHELLQDVQVYCITQVGTEVFILGKTGNGDYAGLKTMVIEGQSNID